MTPRRVTFVGWKWFQPGHRARYTAEHVNVWASMVKRHYAGEKRVLCVTDDPEGITECETAQLWDDHASVPNPNGSHLPSCYRRLKIFHPETARSLGMHDGDVVVSLDLDVVVLQDVTRLFDRCEDFLGWLRISPYHPRAYNGSIFLHKACALPQIWETFNPKSSPAVACKAKYFGSDQGWISYCLRGRYDGWRQVDGVYSFSSDVARTKPAQNARIISFNGKHKPWEPKVQENHPWIRKHWVLDPEKVNGHASLAPAPAVVLKRGPPGPINFVLWKWKQKNFRETYTPAHVNAMVKAITTNVQSDHTIRCITDAPVGVACKTAPLWDDLANMRNPAGAHMPSCFRRLKLFDPATLEQVGIPMGQRVVSIDLDALILRDVTSLFDRPEPYVGFGVVGHKHRQVLNGSMFMFTAGEFEWIWKEFDPDTSPMEARKRGYLGSDQSWQSYRLQAHPDVGVWTPEEHGVHRYMDIRQTRRLPADSRIVFFAGRDKPWHPQTRLKSSWVARYAA